MEPTTFPAVCIFGLALRPFSFSAFFFFRSPFPTFSIRSFPVFASAPLSLLLPFYDSSCPFLSTTASSHFTSLSHIPTSSLHSFPLPSTVPLSPHSLTLVTPSPSPSLLYPVPSFPPSLLHYPFLFPLPSPRVSLLHSASTSECLGVPPLTPAMRGRRCITPARSRPNKSRRRFSKNEPVNHNQVISRPQKLSKLI